MFSFYQILNFVFVVFLALIDRITLSPGLFIFEKGVHSANYYLCLTECVISI